MSPDEYENVPEPVDTVDAVQVPAFNHWNLNPNVIAVVALSVVGGAFAIYFLMQYTQAKAKAVFRAEVSDGSSSQS